MRTLRRFRIINHTVTVFKHKDEPQPYRVVLEEAGQVTNDGRYTTWDPARQRAYSWVEQAIRHYKQRMEEGTL